jgi:ribosomal protein L23
MYKFDKSNLDKIAFLFHVAVEYVNTDSRVQQQITKARDDKAKGLLEVESTGGDATTQAKTKVDLLTKYTVQGGTRQNLLSLSLKAGKVAQFGQVSGGAFLKYKNLFKGMFGEDFFNQLAPPTQNEFKFYKSTEDTDSSPWLIPAPEGMDDKEIKEYNFIKPLKYLYTQVANNFNKIFASAVSAESTNKKTEMIRKIYWGIRNHATLDIEVPNNVPVEDSEVTLLILNPNENKHVASKKGQASKHDKFYTELAFGTSLFEQLKSYAFEAKVEFPDNKTRIVKLYAIRLTPKTNTLTQSYDQVVKQQKKLTGEELFLLKLRSNLSNFRNRVEMGPFLKEIAQIQKDAGNSATKAQ